MTMFGAPSVSRTLQALLLAAFIMAIANIAPAADPAATGTPAEVTVTAEHLKLTWTQRNELVQKATTFVYGIATVDDYYGYPARWTAPVCPYLNGLLAEEAQHVLERSAMTARAAAGPHLASKSRCQPNLRIYVTPQPQEFLKSSDFLKDATQLRIAQFIAQPGP